MLYLAANCLFKPLFSLPPTYFLMQNQYYLRALTVASVIALAGCATGKTTAPAASAAPTAPTTTAPAAAPSIKELTAAAEFTKRAAVVGRQYDAFSPLDSVLVNGKLTMDENLADFAGLPIVYAALQKQLQKQYGDKPRHRRFHARAALLPELGPTAPPEHPARGLASANSHRPALARPIPHHWPAHEQATILRSLRLQAKPEDGAHRKRPSQNLAETSCSPERTVLPDLVSV